jgi:3-dehydroquinate synthase
MERVRVNLEKRESKSYDILIGSDFIKNELSAIHNNPSCHVVMDYNVSRLYQHLYPFKKYVVVSDEHNKNLKSIEDMLHFLKERNCLRNDTVYAVGGGIVGDMTGFASAIYMRGIDFIQIPTTLLSMVDSSVGGKTGVNLGDVKNLIGSFHQPKKVLIDTVFLDTLSEEEFYSGFAEVIKYALIFDNEFYNFLLINHKEIKAKKKSTLEFVIKRCCEIKADIVEQDEMEKGPRRLLNLGHTIGHAIEIDSEHQVKHGHAVAKGIYLETCFARNKKWVTDEALEAVRKIFELYDYNINYDIKDMERFVGALSSDKKAKKSGIVLALTYSLGSGIIKEKIDLNDLIHFLKVSGHE